MGCTESHQQGVQRIKVTANDGNQIRTRSESPEVTRISSAELDQHDPATDEINIVNEPNLVLTEHEKQLNSRLSSGSFSINLSESLDSRLSLSFKSQTPSAGSASSCDSGVYELDEEYSHVITEHGDPDKVYQVERDFVPREHLELCVLGKACPRRQSAKSRDYQDEQLVLNSLRMEGLIQRTQCSSTGGLSFEVVSVDALPEHNNTVVRKLPPLKHERMEQRRKKKRLTQDYIKEKLERAEERRKLQEEEKLSKMKERPKTAVVRNTETNFRQKTMKKCEEKLETITENREKHLEELRERLRTRREHSAKVRLRKMLNPFQVDSPIPEEETQ